MLPGYRPLIVDLYVPPRTQTLRPLILYIHGGGWIGGHTRHGSVINDFPALLASLAGEGLVVASLEYRLAEEGRYPTQLQDARAAVRFLKANAARYGIDPNRVIVWGASAGGHIAALLALSCGVTSIDPEPAPPGSECVQGAAIWYGVFDLWPIVASASDGNPATMLGCATAACTAQAAPPAPLLSSLHRRPHSFSYMATATARFPWSSRAQWKGALKRPAFEWKPSTFRRSTTVLLAARPPKLAPPRFAQSI